MEKLPQIISQRRIPLEIHSFPCFQDHRFEGKAVLPAAESMQILAASVLAEVPEARINCMWCARFDRFIPISGPEPIAALNDLDFYEDGHVSSTLITRSRAGTSLMTRTKEHVTLHFAAMPPDTPTPPPPDSISSADDAVEIPARRLYEELVPFGPAYRNIAEGICLSRSGAVAQVMAPNIPSPDGPLGSPFPLDAAFHTACVWGQRYEKFVAFPVALSRRCVLKATCAGETYTAVGVPVRHTPELLVFDFWLLAQDGTVHEWASGVRMRDVSAGRMKPPEWVMK